jgi:hypothetical protein
MYDLESQRLLALTAVSLMYVARVNQRQFVFAWRQRDFLKHIERAMGSFLYNARETQRALNSSYATEEAPRLPLTSRQKQKFRRRLYEEIRVLHFIFLRVSGLDVHRRLQFNADFR